MKTYEEFAQDGWADFKETKGATLGFYRDAIRVLRHYAENTKLDGDEASAEVFEKYLAQVKANLADALKVYPRQEAAIRKFFADKNINISEWD